MHIILICTCIVLIIGTFMYISVLPVAGLVPESQVETGKGAFQHVGRDW